MSRQRIAIIGAGISGLATAWLLQTRFEVRLFEKEAVPGGHAHTVSVPDPGGPLAIDTGFVVYNECNYPLLTRLFAHLEVPTQCTDMSFAYSLQPGGIEYAGTDLNTLFAQRRNLMRPRFLRMITDILRFNRLGRRLLAQDSVSGITLGQFLYRHRFSAGFTDDYLLPMAAAIWSCPTTTMGAFPARGFLEFFRNHGLLDIDRRPQWRTVVGGSRSYVNRLVERLQPGTIRHQGVTAVQRVAGRWQTSTDAGNEHFDAVVFACHADDALSLLTHPTPEQAAALSACRFQDNRAILHTDARLMPRSKRVWSSWNYLTCRQGVDGQRVSVSYYMNRLHRLDRPRDYIVSLNPWREPHPASVLGEFRWRHPIMDSAAIAAQSRIAAMQGLDGVYLAGAWTGYGFHEDGMRSAVAVARHLGVTPPWESGQEPVPERAADPITEAARAA
ncbi:Amine oxidase, FAD dependent [Thioalkalivibrio nitratireducens DSM 14787]|uniref:Amine oxidase, FAD dependent n=1 Tax=Thioalkalivibrio nitratireducens (strain DSM 14787 / UNIQEM 213 / ALEN2) TaxID=1255043 RepID=L0DZF3_THIND|nr:FAD-dependent oxidoreductase [Thioalkalivibrio nitratireducens]AGA34345.1 Amine oxidase, FAD dependent [Thioalkalivibrio nitratireducens DSM 14787]